jgi:hypothetical protein
MKELRLIDLAYEVEFNVTLEHEWKKVSKTVAIVLKNDYAKKSLEIVKYGAQLYAKFYR